jgi:modification methylase
LPLCTGRERLKINGTKVHPTQKPEALIYRILLACTAPGEVVLDPFMGSGTTGVTAKQLSRNWIGIERDPEMAEIARQRIATVEPAIDPLVYKQFNPRREPRVPFGALLENGLLHPGDQLFFGISGQRSAMIHADGSLDCDGQPGSIHSLGRMLQAGPCNGWQAWYYWDERTQQRLPIDHLRQKLRSLLNRTDERKI